MIELIGMTIRDARGSKMESIMSHVFLLEIPREDATSILYGKLTIS